MKIVDRKTLRQQPVGTIYREFEPFVWVGEWMRFEGACGDNDWFESNIGPTFIMSGYFGLGDIPESLAKQLPKGDDFLAAFAIEDTMGRDGMYKTDALYLVLEPADIALIVEQLTGGQTGEPTYLNIPDTI